MGDQMHRVVIIGGGFAGLNAAKSLKRAPVEVTVVDRRNHHLFQPLLYQVATGGLSPADISAPIRGLLRKQKNARVLLAEVTGIDVEARRVILADGEVPYDTLVLATGVSHSYFGHDDWQRWAPGLKTVDDATAIRRRFLVAFEAAERLAADEEREAWLTFVLVGGGPTGVELAGALGEMARFTLKGNFRSIDPGQAVIYLLEGGDRVLPSYHPKLSANAAKALAKLGVIVRTGALVTEVSSDGVLIEASGGEKEEIASKTVVWAAGVQASPLGRLVAEATGTDFDRAGRVLVDPDFSLSGHPEIFIIGDLASYSHLNGQPMRGTADVATVQGKYVGRAIRRRLEDKPSKRFRFTDRGTMAVIGRAAAVADLFNTVRITGRIAWFGWLFVHILYLVEFEARLTVLVQWGWSYLTRRRAARLITGPLKSPFER